MRILTAFANGGLEFSPKLAKVSLSTHAACRLIEQVVFFHNLPTRNPSDEQILEHLLALNLERPPA